MHFDRRALGARRKSALTTMQDARLPTALWVEGHLHALTLAAVSYYITHKGNPSSGMVMIKLNGLEGQVKLLTQQRDIMTYEMGWTKALDEETVEEPKADEYIQRAISRDPDLWVIEIEDRAMTNPFEGKTF